MAGMIMFFFMAVIMIVVMVMVMVMVMTCVWCVRSVDGVAHRVASNKGAYCQVKTL